MGKESQFQGDVIYIRRNAFSVYSVASFDQCVHLCDQDHTQDVDHFLAPFLGLFPATPSPAQISFLPLEMKCDFLAFRINGIRQHVLSCLWLHSFGMFLRFTDAGDYINSSHLFMADTPWDRQTTTCLAIQQVMNIWSFHLLAIMNKASTDIHLQVYVDAGFHFFLDTV